MLHLCFPKFPTLRNITYLLRLYHKYLINICEIHSWINNNKVALRTLKAPLLKNNKCSIKRLSFLVVLCLSWSKLQVESLAYHTRIWTYPIGTWFSALDMDHLAGKHKPHWKDSAFLNFRPLQNLALSEASFAMKGHYPPGNFWGILQF